MERVNDNFQTLVNVIMWEQLIRRKIYRYGCKKDSENLLMKLTRTHIRVQVAWPGRKLKIIGGTIEEMFQSRKSRQVVCKLGMKGSVICVTDLVIFMNKCPLHRTTDKDTTSGKSWGWKPKSGQHQSEGKDKVGLIHSPTMKESSFGSTSGGGIKGIQWGHKEDWSENWEW